MMNIEKIAEQILENKKKTWKHTKRVVKLCCKFTQQLDVDICVKVLHEAAWLHDTGKTVDKKHHNQETVVSQVLEPYQEELLQCDMDTLLGVIQAHKGDFDPPEGYELESAVLRICDKLDKYHKARIKAGKGDSKEEKGDSKKKWKTTAENYQEAIQKYQEAIEEYEEAVETCNDSMMKIKAVLADDVWNAFEDAYAQVLAQIFQ